MIRRLTGPGLCLALVLSFAACGGGSSTPSTPSTPAPTPTPKPTATPDPTPTPTPDPSATPCTVGLCEPETTNTAQPVKAILRLYQLFDKEGNWVLPTPDPVKQVVKEPIPVGYTIRLDVTAKDAQEKDTIGKKDINFIYSDPEMVQESIQSDFQRKLLVKKTGTFTVFVSFDGVGSNDLRFTFKE
ncbi:MAG TPA: hypothetical protein VMV21_16030 [Vicinamibacteria bacterium]|nr:hypothetical protein [Vicinamibacteria bacterium]